MFNNEEAQELAFKNDSLLDDNMDDLPPELDEIQDLNNSSNLVAPTKKALDAPHSFFDRSNNPNEDSKKDLLDQYENSEVNMLSQINNTEFESPIMASNNILESSLVSQNEVPSFDTGYSSPLTDSGLEKQNTNFSFNANEKDNLSFNNSYEQADSKVVDYEYQNNDTTNSILTSNSESEKNDVPSNNILNDSDESSQELEKNYEIINDKKLSDVDEHEVISEIKDEAKMDDSDTLIMEDEQSSSLEKLKEESLQKIKDIIKDLNSNGVNIRVEEFDFESIHQMIIIVDK